MDEGERSFNSQGANNDTQPPQLKATADKSQRKVIYKQTANPKRTN